MLAITLTNRLPQSNYQLSNARMLLIKSRHARLAVAAPQVASPKVAPIHRPHVVPSTVPQHKGRRAPLVVRFNRALRTVLVALLWLGYRSATVSTLLLQMMWANCKIKRAD